ncbi:MAG: AAA family ATPase [Ruminococcus sp.]|nr:AAA family ATPase [Ruminococcus sp.]
MENETMKFIHDFADLINAGFACLYIDSYEEDRVMQQINVAASNPDFVKVSRKVYTWAQTTGLVGPDKIVPNTQEAVKALDFIEKNSENGIFVLKDFHIYFGGDRGTRPDYGLIRKIRDIIPVMKANRKSIVFLSPKLVIPCELEKEISILDFDLPTEQEIEATLDNLMLGLSPDKIKLTQAEKKQLVAAALGLTLQEAENAFSRAIVKNKGLDTGAINVVHDEKNQTVKKTGVLEFVRSDLSIDDIGGLENMKKWLLRRNNTWSERAKHYDLPAPKGVLITGVPGCGKSLTAKAMSAIWHLPLLKLDMGKIFDGLVGSSEENMRKALDTAEAVAPCILWVDEIEKGFSGARGGGGDSGTTSRVFGTFLTWMQEKTKAVFVIATANDISALPPELLRKGRFDEIFFTDLPTKKEREKIFELHINKRIRNSDIIHDIKVDDALLSTLADMSKGYVGAEIEQIVISALYEAFYNQRGLMAEDLVKAIKATVPLSATQKEQILALRSWAQERAVLATSPEDRETVMYDDGTSGDDTDFRERQGGRILDFDL